MVFLALSVVPRRGLQQCYNNISVFILVWYVFMSSLLIQSLVQHHLSLCETHPAQRLSITLCMVITYSKSEDQPGKVANPGRGQLNGENEYNVSLSPSSMYDHHI